MCADKLRTTFPVPITFSKGEMPTSTKFSEFAGQTKLGLRLLEKAVGDVWNQSGDSVLGNAETYALYQPSLARALGKLALISNRISNGDITSDSSSTPTFSFTDNLSSYQGLHAFYLNGKSISGISFTGTGAPTTSVSTPYDLVSTGQYAKVENVIYTYDPILSDWKITYTAKALADLSGSHNVIPPYPWFTSSSSNLKGLRIKYKNGVDSTAGYYIYLPPRTFTDSLGSYGNLPPETDNVGSGKYWHSATASTVDTSSKYRYILPVTLRKLSSEAAIPEGFVYIWDTSKNTIIEGLSFKYIDAFTLWCTDKSVAEFDEAYSLTDEGQGLKSSTDYLSLYKTRFLLITVGNSLADVVDGLLTSFTNHTHDRQDRSQPISHSDLTDLLTPEYHATLNSKYPSTVPAFTPSRWTNDHHPQYLHRAGYTSGSERDQYNNAMLGDLLLASTSASTNKFLNVSASSNKVVFGKLNTDSQGPSFFFAAKSGTDSFIGLSDFKIRTSSGGETTDDSNVDGSLYLRTADLRIKAPAKNVTGTALTTPNHVRIWLGGSDTSYDGGLLRYQSGGTFGLGFRSGGAEKGADLQTRFISFGDTPLTNGSLSRYKDRNDLDTTKVAGVLWSGQWTESPSRPTIDLSVAHHENVGGAVHLRLNGKLRIDGSIQPAHTIIDGPTDSYLYLKHNRIYFGEVQTDDYISHTDSSNQWAFFSDADTANSELIAGKGTFSGNVTIGGSAVLSMGILALDINKNYQPDIDATGSTGRLLGAPARRWKDIYALNLRPNNIIFGQTNTYYKSFAAIGANSSAGTYTPPAYGSDASGITYWSLSNGQALQHSIELPHGVTLSSFKVYATSAGSSPNLSNTTLKLFRKELFVSSVVPETIGNVTLSTGSIGPSISLTITNSDTIDNNTYMYYLSIELTASSGSMRYYGSQATYTSTGINL